MNLNLRGLTSINEVQQAEKETRAETQGMRSWSNAKSVCFALNTSHLSSTASLLTSPRGWTHAGHHETANLVTQGSMGWTGPTMHTPLRHNPHVDFRTEDRARCQKHKV